MERLAHYMQGFNAPKERPRPAGWVPERSQPVQPEKSVGQRLYDLMRSDSKEVRVAAKLLALKVLEASDREREQAGQTPG